MAKPKGYSRQEYARAEQKNAMSGYNVTDMSPGMKKKYTTASNQSYDNAARDFDASTQFDGITNRSSMPIKGSGMRAMGSGMLLSTKQPVYDSKGNKVKGLR
tara:strand:+ start:4283 stop:4588 length:306 start_codon:yes stop_codon:yes gene_type:complete